MDSSHTCRCDDAAAHAAISSSPTGQILTYLDIMLNDRPTAFGFVTNGTLIIFVKGTVKGGEKCYTMSKELDLLGELGRHGLAVYFLASRTAFGLPPPTVGEYEIGPRLGAGATSFVFTGTFLQRGMKVAVKFVSKEDEVYLVEEYDIIAKIRQCVENQPFEKDAFLKCLPTMELQEYLCGQEHRKAGLVQPLGATFFGSTSHRRFLTRRGLKCLLRALCAAHHAGYVHRDLRPPNMIFLEDDDVLLIDFGYATRVGVTTSYAGAYSTRPKELLSAGDYTPWPMHDLVSLMRGLAYYAETLVHDSYSKSDRKRRLDSSGDWPLATLARIVAVAAETRTAPPVIDSRTSFAENFAVLANAAVRAAKSLHRTLSVQSQSTTSSGDVSAAAHALATAQAERATMVEFAITQASAIVNAEPQEPVMDVGAPDAVAVPSLVNRWQWYDALSTLLGMATFWSLDELLVSQFSKMPITN